MIKELKILTLFFLVCLILTACFALPAAASAIKGSSVWDSDQSMPATYTWTPAMYAGLWYDIDRGVYTENITIRTNASDRQIAAGNAEYFTEVKAMRFSYAEWGSYNVIGWQGEPYFAGYTRSASGNNSTAQFTDRNVSTLSDEKIFKVLTDSADERKFNAGAVFNLENGYRIRISDINDSRKEFRIVLERNGNEVKSEIVSSNSTFIYERSLSGVGTVPIVVIHAKNVDGGQAVIDGIFQISESSVDVNKDRKIGAMQITDVNNTTILMKNPDRINLNRNSFVTLMGHIRIDVKDTTRLKYELVSDPKTDHEKKYPNRGAVYDANNHTIKNWNGMNFPGLSYDLENKTETESLTINVSGSPGNISPGEILYQTSVYNVSFNFSGWGSFMALNLGGDEYFAGYARYNSSDRNNTTRFTDSNISLLDDGRISKVLINNNSSSHNVNSTITLQEGYTLHIENSTTSNRVNLVLKRNGTTVKESAVAEGENFVYETGVGGTTVPLIAVHVSSIFVGSNSTTVGIGGIFQISASSTDVSLGKVVDNMRVEYTSKGSLIFVNRNTVQLTRGSDVRLMQNLSLHIADSTALRFFPYSAATSGNVTLDRLRIDVPETIAPYQEITIRVYYQDGTAWKDAANAAVRVNNVSVGDTDASGIVRYTAGSAGTYEFRADKSGYQSAAVTKIITGEGEELLIIIPDYIFAEDFYNLYTQDKDGKNISGVSVYKDGVHIGTTNDNGMINVTADTTAGTYALTAVKSGYKSASKELRILEYGPYFTVASISIPEENVEKKNIRIPIEIVNVGKEKATQDVIIRVGDVTETKRLTLDAGDSRNFTFIYKPTEPGEETLEVANQTFTITVTEKPETEIPWKWALTGGGLLILIVAAVAALLFYLENKEGEQKNGGKKQPKGKAAGSGFSSAKSSSKSSAGSKSSGSSSSSSGSSSSSSASGESKNSHKFSSSNKEPELKNSQKKARK
ncbi:MAG: hypothetical protein FWE54_04810 [Methanimicrococcus sp.]|nr:hypothetical protein [Methanimicrococcus sp.]